MMPSQSKGPGSATTLVASLHPDRVMLRRAIIGTQINSSEPCEESHSTINLPEPAP